MTRTAEDDQLISRIFLLEGGSTYSNRPTDRGGPTKYGITLATLQNWRKERGNLTQVTAADVQALSEEEAREITFQRYLVEPGIVLLADPGLRLAMVDFTVLFGPDDSIPTLQRLAGTRPDGRLGPLTAAAANKVEARHLVNGLAVERVKLHASKVVDDLRSRGVALGQAEFLRGWLNRALGFIV